MHVSLKVWTQAVTGAVVGTFGSVIGMWIARGHFVLGGVQVACGFVVAVAFAGPTFFQEFAEQRREAAAAKRAASRPGRAQKSTRSGGSSTPSSSAGRDRRPTGQRRR